MTHLKFSDRDDMLRYQLDDKCESICNSLEQYACEDKWKIIFNSLEQYACEDKWKIIFNSLEQYAQEAKWEIVIRLYYKFPEKLHTEILPKLDGTALHAAIDLNNEDVVKELLNAILSEVHNTGKIGALETKNKRGDTPLHLAASKDLAGICKRIIGKDNERIYLLSLKNNYGETPLFQAIVNGRKQTFVYLSDISKDIVTLQDLVRHDGDNILHAAIRGEYFDLAMIIVHYYQILITICNNKESTPIIVLATRPLAFKSASNLSWYQRIIYHCILVEQLDVERRINFYLKEMTKIEANQNSNKMKFPDNCTTLYNFISIGKNILKKKKQPDVENPSEKYRVEFFSQNYETFQQVVKSAFVHTLGLSGVELKDVKIAKQKHEWSSQLLKALMERPYAAFTRSGGRPTDRDIDLDMHSTYPQRKQDGITSKMENVGKQETKSEIEIDKNDTPLLVAARNGIVEMVNEILIKIPSAIHNANSKKENVLHVAVKYGHPVVVHTLKKLSEPGVWNNLVLAVDKDENTILHLAADVLCNDNPLQIAGSAFKMTWDIKWFEYIKSLVPPHFYFISNNTQVETPGKTPVETTGEIFRKTPGEIFKEKHVELIKEGSNWLKETSQSCSVVAALVAGVSFATASSVPGGTTVEGIPALEGKTAFHVFAISSLVGLCSSVAGLIAFLSVLTSRKQAKDFRRALPLKLFIGLSSLSVSVVSMLVSFCTGHFFLLNHQYKSVMFPLYGATFLPATFYVVAQFPLYYDIYKAIFYKI